MTCDKCAYCDSVEGLEWHHILPKSLGGPDEAFNLIRVCNMHHALLHGMSGRGNIAELTKVGLEVAKAKGIKLGGKLIIPPDTLSAICMERDSTTLDKLSSKYNFDRTTISRLVTKWRDNLMEYKTVFEAQQIQIDSKSAARYN